MGLWELLALLFLTPAKLPAPGTPWARGWDAQEPGHSPSAPHRMCAEGPGRPRLPRVR